MIVSRTPFANSHKYIRYRKRNRQPEYIYTNERFEDQALITPVLLIFYIPFIAFALCFMLYGVHIPQKMKPPASTEIQVKDDLGIFSEESKIKKELTEFYELTGIVPAIVTVNNDVWEPYYTSLENYAYDLYVNSWNDEKHWLIVYSNDQGTNPDFLDWHWEGMQGDDTDGILTEEKNR